MRQARPRPREVSPFVGRREALDHLGAAVAAARLGRFAGVLVDGPAGIGKSRLLDELVRLEATGGSLVHVPGRAVVDGGGASPLAPVRALVELAAVDLAVPLSAGEQTDDQERLFRSIGDGLERAAAGSGPLLVTLEDLHWADVTTLELLTFLTHRLAGSPVAVIATHRDGHETTPHLRTLIVALSRDPGVTRLHLGPLSDAELAELAARRLGAEPDPTLLAQVRTRSDGITLFAEELLDTHARGESTDGVPPSLRELFLTGLDRLGDTERELVDLVAVNGGTARHALLAALVEAPARDLEKRLDAVLDAGVLVPEPHGYRFRHDLLRETVDAELRPAARSRHHGAIAQVLTDQPSLRGGSSAALALHRRAAGDIAGALEATVAASREAATAGAYADELGHDLAALELAGELPAGAVDRAPLLSTAARGASRAGEHAQAAELIVARLELTTEPLERLGLLADLLAEQYLANDAAGAGRTARQALAEVPDDAPDAVRGRLLGSVAFAFADPAVPGTPLEATTEGLRLARLSGDRTSLVVVLASHGLALAADGRIAEAQSAFDEAEVLAESDDDPRYALRPRLYRLLLGFDPASSIELGRQAVARADRMGASRGIGKQMRAVLSDLLVATGRWDEADSVIDDGLAWGSHDFAGMLMLLNRASLSLSRGDLAAAEADLATALEQIPAGHPRSSLVASELAWWRGDARASAFHAGQGLQLAVVTARANEVPALTHALARALPGDAGPDMLAGLTMATAVLRSRAGNPVNHAWLLTVDAERSGEASDWSQAVEAWRLVEHDPMTGYAAWRCGEAHLEAGDAAAAHSCRRDAEEIAARLGLQLFARSSDPSGGADDASAAPGRWVVPDAYRLGLTPREAEVLSLLTEGWPNKRIAEELVISPRTVGIHVSHLLAKLGVATRGEATALVRRLTTSTPPTATPATERDRGAGTGAPVAP